MYEIHKSVNEAGADTLLSAINDALSACEAISDAVTEDGQPFDVQLEDGSDDGGKDRIQAAIDALTEVETQLELATEDLDLELGATYEP